MTEAFIHDEQDPNGRPATYDEIAGFLAGMITADGTPILDIYNATCDDD